MLNFILLYFHTLIHIIKISNRVRSVNSKSFIFESEFTFSSLKEMKSYPNMKLLLFTERTHNLFSYMTIHCIALHFTLFIFKITSESPISLHLVLYDFIFILSVFILFCFNKIILTDIELIYLLTYFLCRSTHYHLVHCKH